MRSREQDRQKWQDPDFNKWLDGAISDAGHAVWDAIPDVGSAWNGWDAAKAALGYYCPACSGSGEEIHVTYHGPDSFERLGHCTACNGDGRTSAALAVASERLVSETAHRGDLQARVWGFQHQLGQLETRRADLHKALADCVQFLEGELLQKFGKQSPQSMHPETYRVYCQDMTQLAKFQEFLKREAGQ